MIIVVILLISFLATFPTVVDAIPANISVLATTLASSRELSNINICGCPLNDVPPPINDPSAKLDGPSPGLALKYVALGRGTQNYSCPSASNAVPTAIGAVATLFDASCLAVTFPNILNNMPPALVQMSQNATFATAMALDQLSSAKNGSLVLGQHYFVDSVTPSFDFRNFGHPDWIEATKEESVSAPPYSIPGSVPWLKLGCKAGSGIKVSVLKLSMLINCAVHY